MHEIAPLSASRIVPFTPILTPTQIGSIPRYITFSRCKKARNHASKDGAAAVLEEDIHPDILRDVTRSDMHVGDEVGR